MQSIVGINHVCLCRSRPSSADIPLLALNESDQCCSSKVTPAAIVVLTLTTHIGRLDSLIVG
jgi:hypothetical protein